MGEQGLEEWEGWPWNNSILPGIKFCSSVPQLFDYINDPTDLVDENDKEPKANVRVRIENIMQCATFHGRTRRSET